MGEEASVSNDPSEQKKRDKAMQEMYEKESLRNTKDRQSSFDNYGESRKAAEKGIDDMMSAKDSIAVRDNAKMAMELEEKADKGLLTGSRTGDMFIPGANILSLVQSKTLKGAARTLREGGRAILDERGSVVGAAKYDMDGNVIAGSYYGQSEYDPTKTVTPDESPEAEGAMAKKDGTGESGVEVPKAKKPAASRRSLIAGGGGASRRVFF